MSDAASHVNGSAPRRARKPAAKVKVAGETRGLAAAAEKARDKLVDTATKDAFARRAAVQAWARERAEVAGEAVQERPVTAIAAALGVGIIIGLLAGR
jgi:ElaB/YqjD/DUF883 family membrane-anchored ribosome-binding protein